MYSRARISATTRCPTKFIRYPSPKVKNPLITPSPITAKGRTVNINLSLLMKISSNTFLVRSAKAAVMADTPPIKIMATRSLGQ